MEDARDESLIRRAPILLRIAQAFAGVLVGLAIADAGLGVYRSRQDLRNERLSIPDLRLGWTNRPGYAVAGHSINSLGIRGREIEPDAPADEVRVLAVGASRTYGAGKGSVGNDGMWSQVLEDRLVQEQERPWRVLNGGVMGYSAVQAARRAALLLDDVDPDLVLVFISPGRQMLLDPSQARKWVRVGAELVSADIADAWPEALVPTVNAVHGAMLHSNIYSRWHAQIEQGAKVPAHILNFVLTRTEPLPEVTRMLDRTWAELAALAQLCDERGIEIRAVMLLEAFQSSPQRWRTYLTNRSKTGAPPLGTSRQESLDVLAERLADVGIESWSFFDAISTMGAAQDDYTIDGAHWTELGHALIAEALYERFVASGLDRSLAASRAASPRD